MSFSLTLLERVELVRRATNLRCRAQARRARIVLMLHDGQCWNEIMKRLRCSRGLVARWSSRFKQHRIAGLDPRHRGKGPSQKAEALEARILREARKRRADGRPRWSTRGLAARLGISHMMVQRIWNRHGLNDERRAMRSTTDRYRTRQASSLRPRGDFAAQP